MELVESPQGFKIVAVAPRRNEVYRMLVREKKKKVSASNVDYLVVVCSVSKPVYKRGLLDRYLVRAEQWGIAPLIVFNKMDEYAQNFDLEFELERLCYQDLACFQTSSKHLTFSTFGAARGLIELKQKLTGKTTLFLGQSGVGKSTLISVLSDGKIILKSGQLGKAGKGRHTTTWNEMVESDALTLIDSPGIRSFALDDIQAEELMQFFPRLQKMLPQCQFSNCEHTSTSSGCCFYSAQSYKSQQEQKIILSYLDSYQRFLSEVKKVPFWKK